VQRDGKARSFHVANIDGNTIRPLLYTAVRRDTHLMTDKAKFYIGPGREYVKHDAVNRREWQYVVGKAHTNTVESFFSIFKRGVISTYRHMSEVHLHRYCAKFDFRYNTRNESDFERTNIALCGIAGEPLTYRRIDRLAA